MHVFGDLGPFWTSIELWQAQLEGQTGAAMTKVRSNEWVVTLLAISVLSAGIACAEPKPLKCEIGPVTKTFGKTQWLIYSCDDNKSLVIVAADGNPATPFVFMVTSTRAGHEIHGEGTGDKVASDAANAEISKLSESDIAALVAEARLIEAAKVKCGRHEGEGRWTINRNGKEIVVDFTADDNGNGAWVIIDAKTGKAGDCRGWWK